MAAVVGAAVALATVPATASAAPVATLNVCEYSVDGAWRDTPILFTPSAGTGSVSTASGVDTVTMPGSSFEAILPSWFVSGAVGEGFLPPGHHVFPVTAWIAVEATNAVSADDPSSNVVWKKIDGPTVTLDTDDPTAPSTTVSFPQTTWYATGGKQVALRQAGGGALPALPIGRNGSALRVNGSIAVRVDMSSIGGDGFVLDCLPGNIRDGSGTLTAATIGKSAATAATVAAASGYVGIVPGTGAVPGGDAEGHVEAEISHVPGAPGYVGGTGAPAGAAGWQSAFGAYNAGVLPLPPRAEGDALVFPYDARNVLRVRLTPAQRAAWLGGTPSGAVDVRGWAQIDAQALAPASRLIELQPRSWNPSPDGDGKLTLEFDLPTTGWTAAGNDGSRRELRPGVLGQDLPGGIAADGATAVLVASVGGSQRTLQLSRGRYLGAGAIAAPQGTPPFLVVPPPPAYEPYVPPPAPPGGEVPPPLTDTPGFRPPPPPRAKTPAAVKTTTLRVTGATSVRRQKGRVAVRIRNLDKQATTKARVEIKTTGRHRIGRRKARVVTLVSRTTVTLKKGQTRTYRLKLSKDAASLLRSKRSVAATIRIVPTKSDQATVTRKLTVRR